MRKAARSGGPLPKASDSLGQQLRPAAAVASSECGTLYLTPNRSFLTNAFFNIYPMAYAANSPVFGAGPRNSTALKFATKQQTKRVLRMSALDGGM
jgi:hypothetical protein